MPRKLFRKYTPSVDRVREVKALGIFGERLFHPALWHLNRRSAARGVAVGMFCGLIPGPLQMLGAALVCLVVRVNLPVAILTTLYTNPFTIVPLYLLAYKLGSFALGASGKVKFTNGQGWLQSGDLDVLTGTVTITATTLPAGVLTVNPHLNPAAMPFIVAPIA